MDQPRRGVVICGLGRIGWPVLDYLRQAGWDVTAIDTTCAPDDPRLAGIRFVRGDARFPETLERLDLRHAQAVLILTGDDQVNLATALMIRRLHPGLRIIVRIFNQTLKDRLSKFLPNMAFLSTSALTAPLLAMTALSGEALGAFESAGGPCQVAELRVTPGSELIGRRVGHLTAHQTVAVLAYVPEVDQAAEPSGTVGDPGQSGPMRPGMAAQLLDAVPADAVVAVGDRLTLCGPPGEVARLLARVEEDGFGPLRWAGSLRRLWRALVRTFLEIDLAPKLAIGAFALVVALGAAVYHLGLDFPLSRGLFRTISVMATAADMHEQELTADWQRVFVSLLRIAGVVLTAAMTALLTNYLVRARLGAALAVRRIPEGGHVVLCGLGNVGFRVLEELTKLGMQVVVVERDAGGRFVTAARQKGAVVLIGDGLLEPTLQQANVVQARAFIAATSQDLVNLEAALVARELNPRSRVVVRLDDPRLADTLREAARVRHALALPVLAAPAFVAAIYHDRVRSLFRVAGRPMAAVEIEVRNDDPRLVDQAVRGLAVDYHFAVVDVWSHGAVLPPDRRAAHRLGVGDRLTVVMLLSDLDRFLRRETPPAEWSVQVSAYPLPMRDGLLQLIRTHRHLDAAGAEQVLASLPITLASGLTRGQAEDLLAHLRRERITAAVVRS
jgi:Trk K+ transport system NAD-binding subunit